MDAIKTFENASSEGKLDMFEEAYNGWVKPNAVIIERDEELARVTEYSDATAKNYSAAMVENVGLRAALTASIIHIERMNLSVMSSDVTPQSEIDIMEAVLAAK